MLVVGVAWEEEEEGVEDVGGIEGVGGGTEGGGSKGNPLSFNKILISIIASLNFVASFFIEFERARAYLLFFLIVNEAFFPAPVVWGMRNIPKKQLEIINTNNN